MFSGFLDEPPINENLTENEEKTTVSRECISQCNCGTYRVAIKYFITEFLVAEMIFLFTISIVKSTETECICEHKYLEQTPLVERYFADIKIGISYIRIAF